VDLIRYQPGKALDGGKPEPTLAVPYAGGLGAAVAFQASHAALFAVDGYVQRLFGIGQSGQNRGAADGENAVVA